MSKRLLPFLVLIAILSASCGGELFEPPQIYLVSDNGLVHGFQGSYCWDSGKDGVLCMDTVAPHFESSIPLDAGAPIRFHLDTPLPDEVFLSISKEVLGDSIYSETRPASDFIDWYPAVPPGEYIVYVHGEWKQGIVGYWFSVSLE